MVHPRSLVLLLLLAPALNAQPPASLRDALARAATASAGNRLATARVREAQAQRLLPGRGILPTLQVDVGAVRTTDPIGAFGTRLRQGILTADDFDPRRLTAPAPIDNVTAAVVLQQPLVNADAWLARRAATHAADAQVATAAWTQRETSVAVIRAWYGAALAVERHAMLTEAVRVAQAQVQQADALVTNGAATRSDALLARVRAGELEAQRVEADGAVRLAARQLAVVLGDDRATVATPTVVLPAADRLRRFVAADTLEGRAGDRADLAAADAAYAAARTDAGRARATWVPRLNAIARRDWNGAQRPFGGPTNWTVGVMASWLPFAGGADLGGGPAPAARLTAARAQRDAATAQSQLQQDEARLALIVALDRLAIAERSVQQGTEAYRIVARKYAGGLATVAELLAAHVTATQTALGLASAQYDTIVAAARRRLALGLDPATLAELEATSVALTSTPDSTGVRE